MLVRNKLKDTSYICVCEASDLIFLKGRYSINTKYTSVLRMQNKTSLLLYYIMVFIDAGA